MKYLKYFELLNNINYENGTLTSLNGLKIPKHIDGRFKCYNNQITSLEFGPEYVTNDYSCSDNNLTSLKYYTSYIGGNFYFYGNKIKSLKYCPETVGGVFDCHDNNLTSLEFCPKNIGGGINCSFNQLTSLEFCPENIDYDFDCSYNQLTSLDFLPDSIGGIFQCNNNNWINHISLELMKKYKIKLTLLYIDDQKENFGSYEYQKEFLTNNPEKYKELEIFGYNDQIKEEFDWLFNAANMGLI